MRRAGLTQGGRGDRMTLPRVDEEVSRARRAVSLAAAGRPGVPCRTDPAPQIGEQAPLGDGLRGGLQLDGPRPCAVAGRPRAAGPSPPAAGPAARLEELRRVVCN